MGIHIVLNVIFLFAQPQHGMDNVKMYQQHYFLKNMAVTKIFYLAEEAG